MGQLRISSAAAWKFKFFLSSETESKWNSYDRVYCDGVSSVVGRLSNSNCAFFSSASPEKFTSILYVSSAI